jgi:hypothetical protein
MYCKTLFWELWSSFDNVAKVMLRLFLICSYLEHEKRWATVRSLLQVHLGGGELLKRCPWVRTVWPIRSLVSTIESFLFSNWIHFQGSVCGLIILNLLDEWPIVHIVSHTQKIHSGFLYTHGPNNFHHTRPGSLISSWGGSLVSQSSNIIKTENLGLIL